MAFVYDLESFRIGEQPAWPLVYKRYKKPVLMTEIGTNSGSEQQKVQLIKELLPFLDGLDTVSHYAWFMAGQGILVNNDGSLTALGKAYQSA